MKKARRVNRRRSKTSGLDIATYTLGKKRTRVNGHTGIVGGMGLMRATIWEWRDRVYIFEMLWVKDVNYLHNPNLLRQCVNSAHLISYYHIFTDHWAASFHQRQHYTLNLQAYLTPQILHAPRDRNSRIWQGLSGHVLTPSAGQSHFLPHGSCREDSGMQSTGRKSEITKKYQVFIQESILHTKNNGITFG